MQIKYVTSLLIFDKGVFTFTSIIISMFA